MIISLPKPLIQQSMKANRVKSRKPTQITANKINFKMKDMEVTSWAPELINGRCAMLGYVAGYGYELVNHEPLRMQFLDQVPSFLCISLFVTITSMLNGKPTNEDVKINGLTPEAELFNGRAAMIGITSTLVYEFMSNNVSI